MTAVTESATTLPERNVSALAGTWGADTIHSGAYFRLLHYGFSWFRGTFDEFDVNVSVTDDGEVSITGAAPVSSIAFRNDHLTAHVQSPEFFDSALHPEVAFATETVQLHEDGTLKAGGHITIRGVSRPVSLAGTWSPVIEDMMGNERWSISLGAEIDRTEFGLNWNAPLKAGGNVLAKTVVIEGEFELTRG